MMRIILAILIILMGLNPALCEDSQQPEQIREVYKIKGHIEYDDNPVETIYLDENVDKPTVNIPKHTITLPVNVLNITSNSNTRRSALARAMIYNSTLTDIMPLSGALVEKIGGFSYGQTWGQEISYSQLESTSAFFLRYDTPKRFSLTASTRQTARQEIGSMYNTLRLTPEWHISDKLTLKNSFTNYVDMPKNKNEITIVYTPALKKYAESLKFELGVAQSYYQNGKQSSAVSFSTGFKL